MCCRLWGHLLGVMCLLARAAHSQDWNELDKIFRSMMDCNQNLASFAISAVKDGDVIFNNVYGMADREKNISVSNNTRFTIGSISKTFTSYLAGKQVEDGEYTFDTTIVDAFKKQNVEMNLQGDFRSESATLLDAMSHRTTIKQYDWLLTDDREISRAEWITQYLPKFGEMADFRAEFYYNNWLFTMVGYLIELVGGSSFENQIKETIFDPLEMDESCFVSDSEFDELSGEEFALPYKQLPSTGNTLYPIPISALKRIGTHNPAGGIVSTATDMAKYMNALIAAYNGEEDAVLEKAVLRRITGACTHMGGMQMGDPTAVEKPTFNESFVSIGYGIGYISGTYRGYEFFNHGGATYGHYSLITIIPSKNIGVFTVVSGDTPGGLDNWRMQKAMLMYMLDVMLGEEPWIDAETGCSFPEPWFSLNRNMEPRYQEADNTTVPTPQIYVGNYSTEVFPRLSIVQRDNLLQFEMGNSNGTIVPLSATNEKLAVIMNLPVDPPGIPDVDKTRVYMAFDRNSEGKVTALHLDTGGPSETFTFMRNTAAVYQQTSSVLLLLLLLHLLIFRP